MKIFYTTNKLSEKMHETQEGFLVCVGVPIARTGEMIYGENETPLTADDEGKVVIHREEKDVFNPNTMASFEGKPITITHPTEFVTKDNWSRLAKGVVQNVRRGEGDQSNDLIADLLVTDSVAINLIKNGLREVSCGYEANYTQTGDGEGKQTKIIGNHLALVDQGRAGSSYAINDHKGKGIEKMKLKDKIKSIFARAQDEAMKVAEDEAGEKADEKKDDSKDGLKEGDPAHGLSTYDDVMKACKDLMGMVEKMGAKKDSSDADESEKKDDSKDADKDDSKKDDSKDADKDEEKKDESSDEESSASLEDRLKALEASVAKLLEKQSGDASEGEEKAEDEDMEESEDAFEPNTMTGDAASRAEILAPGVTFTGKDAKAKALKAAYATVEGKKVIDSLTGGKPTFDSAEKVNTLFIAASEVLKATRSDDLSKTKKSSSTRDNEGFIGAMTPERMNEVNSKFYKQA